MKKILFFAVAVFFLGVQGETATCFGKDREGDTSRLSKWMKWSNRTNSGLIKGKIDHEGDVDWWKATENEGGSTFRLYCIGGTIFKKGRRGIRVDIYYKGRRLRRINVGPKTRRRPRRIRIPGNGRVHVKIRARRKEDTGSYWVRFK